MHGINDPSGYVPHQPPPEKAGEGHPKEPNMLTFPLVNVGWNPTYLTNTTAFESFLD